MRRLFLFAPLFALLLAAAPPATQPASPLNQRAHRILDNLKQSTYQHPTDIDEPAGKFNCDCSGLVTWLLRKELPDHYKAVPFPKPRARPRAREFHDAFAAAPANPGAKQLWQRVDSLADARPGDLIAWRKDPLPETGSTGHIVLVDSTPKPLSENLYELTIIDSTTAPHKDDTRKQGETGVGRGSIFFKTDKDGRPTAYATRSAAGAFLKFPMSIGRPLLPANN
jgi:hypothetical protein